MAIIVEVKGKGKREINPQACKGYVAPQAGENLPSMAQIRESRSQQQQAQQAVAPDGSCLKGKMGQRFSPFRFTR